MTDRNEMIKRVRTCIKRGADPIGLNTLDIVAVDDANWEKKDTLVSLYMFRVIHYLREGTLEEQMRTFMLPKAARTSDPFDAAHVTALAAAYTGTWDGETGDMDKLHAFVDAFTVKQLACIGI